MGSDFNVENWPPYLSPVENWHLFVSLYNGCVNFQEVVTFQQIFSFKMTGRVIFQWGSTGTQYSVFVLVSLLKQFFFHAAIFQTFCMASGITSIADNTYKCVSPKGSHTEKNRGAAHVAAHGLHVGNGVGSR